MEIYRSFYLIFVLCYVLWLLLFYSNLFTNNESAMFHQKNFIRLCETNYENLNVDARKTCELIQ